MLLFLFKHKTVSITVINFVLKREVSVASNNVLYNDFSTENDEFSRILMYVLFIFGLISSR